MKVPLRGRGGKQDRPQESKSAFSFHLSVTHTFLQPEGSRGHFPGIVVITFSLVIRHH